MISAVSLMVTPSGNPSSTRKLYYRSCSVCNAQSCQKLSPKPGAKNFIARNIETRGNFLPHRTLQRTTEPGNSCPRLGVIDGEWVGVEGWRLQPAAAQPVAASAA